MKIQDIKYAKHIIRYEFTVVSADHVSKIKCFVLLLLGIDI